MTNRAEFERLLDVYGFRCERFGQDLSTHARAQVVSAFAALASAPVAGNYDPGKLPSAANFPPAWTTGAPCYAADGKTLTYSVPDMPIMVRAVDFNALWSTRQASAPVAGEAQPEIEQMAVNRYRPVPDGKFSYKVVAGDGSRSLYTGTKDSCLRVAAKLTEAFLDGAFVASDAAPQASECECSRKSKAVSDSEAQL